MTDNPWKKRKGGRKELMPSRALLAEKDGRRATATWGFYGRGQWRCISCTSFLKWMLHSTSPEIMRATLDEKAIYWGWIEPDTAKVLAPPF